MSYLYIISDCSLGRENSVTKRRVGTGFAVGSGFMFAISLGAQVMIR